ncbi:ParB/RepB/Spo0J family partition protein [Sorangium sp. So ce693]|uniref:ParB/RepB/Spo0J family partition protein n=1 Tax=Sorangium sp. So ce693 TaxID=3133318 RepID=UPI003F646D3F
MTRSMTPAAGEPLRRSDRIIVEAPVNRLIPSPTQPRTRNRDGADLVESVREHGVLEPLWIRSSVEEGTYEIIFGERRWNAAKVAELATVPAEHRDDLTVEQVVVLQQIENGQREDVSPLDEARSYQLLQQRFGRATHEIARMVNKTEARVLRRLKLLTLPEDAQRALEGGALPLRSAEALGRIQHPDDRAAAVARVLAREEFSPFEVTRMVEREFMLRLSAAQFDPDDARLVPDAGPCSRCPKRSGAQMLLYAVAGEDEDRCTDRTCFAAKQEAHWGRVSAAAVARGARVVDGLEAARLYPHGGMAGKTANEYVELDNPCYMVPPNAPPAGAVDADDDELPRARSWREVLQRPAPVMVVRDPHGRVHELVPRSEAVQALERAGALTAPEEPRAAPAGGRSAAEARVARAAEQSAYEKALGAIADKAGEMRPTAAFWRFLVALLLQVVDTWHLSDVIARRKVEVRGDESEADAIVRDVAGAKEPETRAIAIEILVGSQGDASYARDGSALHMAALFYGVDLKRIHAAALRKARETAAQDAREAAPKRPAKGKARQAAASPPAKAGAPPDARQAAASSTAKSSASRDARQAGAGEEACAVCGCTEDAACEGGCCWVAPTLCSVCGRLQERIVEVLAERSLSRAELRAGLEAEEQPFAQRTHAACDELAARKVVRERDQKLELVQRRLFTSARPQKGRSTSGAQARAEAP